MTRFVPVTVLMVVLAASHVASADMGSLPNGTTITFPKLYIHEDGNKNLDLPKVIPDSLWKYFNLAHCQCSKEKAGFVENTFAYLLTAQGSTTPINQPLQIWVGSSCDGDVATRTAMCHRIDSQTPQISAIQQPAGVQIEIPIYDAMTPETSLKGMDCQLRAQSATVWGIADSMGSGTLDYFVSNAMNPITTDAKPPPLPSNFHASGGDQAIEISWTPPSDTSDTYAYQALCMRADTSAPGKITGRPTRRYQTASTLCGGPESVDLGTGTDIGGATGTITASNLPGALANLDPSFLCGEELSATTTNLRISGLENGVAYKVVLLAVDKFQNASGTFFTSTLTPVPATDFWEDIHDRGGKVDGGLCLLAETYGDDSFLTRTLRAFRDDTLGSSPAGRWLSDAYYATLGKLGAYVHGSVVLRLIAAVVLAPLVVLALLWHWLTLPGLFAAILLAWLWRRRRNLPQKAVRVAATTAAMAMLALLPGRAHAGGYQPYWEDSDPAAQQSEAAADEPSLVTWHAGIRLGPYVPQIDKQFDMTPGPYKQMFGGAQVLPMLDIDRILWTGFGQFGVGGSAGYMQKSAHQFADQTSASDANRLRADADTNTFRLIPIALTATYRLTWLDDAYGIPVVPYVRGGLSYYLWWLNVSDGSLARVCKNAADMEPNCSQNKALGASLGVQGSIGLAIRAERVDPSAAMSMRQSGIQHAGIYGELSLAKVDGFGSNTKLSVGDRTWFAGVDFEF